MYFPLSLQDDLQRKAPNLRDSVMGKLRSAGVKPSLNPSGPNGTAGSALPSASIPSISGRIPDIGGSSSIT